MMQRRSERAFAQETEDEFRIIEQMIMRNFDCHRQAIPFALRKKCSAHASSPQHSDKLISGYLLWCAIGELAGLSPDRFNGVQVQWSRSARWGYCPVVQTQFSCGAVLWFLV